MALPCVHLRLEDAESWLRKKGWSKAGVGKIRPLLDPDSYALRPFFLARLAETDIAQSVRESAGTSLLSILIDLMVDRESRKFGDPVDRVLSAEQRRQYAHQFLREAAQYMADDQMDIILTAGMAGCCGWWNGLAEARRSGFRRIRRRSSTGSSRMSSGPKCGICRDPTTSSARHVWAQAGARADSSTSSGLTEYWPPIRRTKRWRGSTRRWRTQHAEGDMALRNTRGGRVLRPKCILWNTGRRNTRGRR